MLEETNNQQSEINEPAKRGRGRPRKNPVGEPTVTKETRVPVAGFRDVLTVEGKDPEYHYRFVLDQDEKGQRIFQHQRAGYTFCTPDEGLTIGQSAVYKSDGVGSIIRVPNEDGRWLYLMKMPKDWHEEDVAKASEQVDATEESLQHSTVEGSYGHKLDISRSR